MHVLCSAEGALWLLHTLSSFMLLLMFLLPGMNTPPTNPYLFFKAKLHIPSSQEPSLGEEYRALDGLGFESVLCPLLPRIPQAGY